MPEGGMKLLVIEDEQKVAALIKEGLEEKGFSVELAYDGNMGQRLALTRDYDVVLIDIVIPGINGFELCKILKADKPNVPVIMLTTLATTQDKVAGFNAGADDYLLKPFEFDELEARLKAVMRRHAVIKTNLGDVLRYEDLKLDLDKKVAVRAGKTIKLSAKELSLLEFFMQNVGRVIPRAELAKEIWDIKFETGTNVVEVYINMLRNKIDKEFEPKLLHTRIGMGYVLIKEE